MGLDMYLLGKISIFDFPAKTRSIINQIVQEELGLEEDGNNTVFYATVELIYWRKTNAIHAWFIKNVQDGNDDCGEYRVSMAKLSNLHNLIKEVLEDRTKAEELLPTQSGFFFGGTEYNDWYFSDLERTKKELEFILHSEKLKCADFYYTSSW